MVPPTDVETPEGFKFYLYQIQVHQSMAMRAQTEFYRRAMTWQEEWPQGRIMGALYWQTNEIWPGCSWASLGELLTAPVTDCDWLQLAGLAS